MILIFRTRTILIAVLLATAVAGCTLLIRPARVSMVESNYRIFVAGSGTIEGKWESELGIAVIGLETRSAPLEGQELKVIDLLITNGRSEELRFDSDITLINSKGERYTLKAKGQREVVLKAGGTSQGTVILDVPMGTPDRYWLLEIKGGPLKNAVVLPLKVQKIRD